MNQDNVRTLMTPETRRHWTRYILGCPREKLSAAAKTVLIALETFADYRDGTNAHPGIERLAEICGLKERAVRYALARAVELGLIEQTSPANPRAGRATVYRLLPVPANAFTTGTAVPVNNSITGTAVPVEDTITGTATTPSPAPPRHHHRHGRAAHLPSTFQVPLVVSESGTSPSEPITAHTPKPSRFCDAHPLGYAGKCGDCANARTAFEAWTAAQAEIDTAIAAADDLERRRRKRLLEKCPDCSGIGRRPDPEDGEYTIVCDHPNMPPDDVGRVGYG